MLREISCDIAVQHDIQINHINSLRNFVVLEFIDKKKSKNKETKKNTKLLMAIRNNNEYCMLANDYDVHRVLNNLKFKEEDKQIYRKELNKNNHNKNKWLKKIFTNNQKWLKQFTTIISEIVAFLFDEYVDTEMKEANEKSTDQQITSFVVIQI